jgi:hypothetical protein
MDYFTLFGLPASYTLSLEPWLPGTRSYSASIIPISSPAAARPNSSPRCSSPPPLIRRGKPFAIR